MNWIEYIYLYFILLSWSELWTLWNIDIFYLWLRQSSTYIANKTHMLDFLYWCFIILSRSVSLCTLSPLDIFQFRSVSNLPHPTERKPILSFIVFLLLISSRLEPTYRPRYTKVDFEFKQICLVLEVVSYFIFHPRALLKFRVLKGSDLDIGLG